MTEIEGILIPVSGPCRIVRLKRDDFNDLVHQLIDCSLYYCVRVTIGDYDVLMLVDDCGLLMHKPCNVRASELYGSCIVGDVVLVGETCYEGEPDFGSVPMPIPLIVSHLFNYKIECDPKHGWRWVLRGESEDDGNT